jgi:hypothetical protein
MRVWCVFLAPRLSRSNTLRHGRTRVGMGGLRHDTNSRAWRARVVHPIVQGVARSGPMGTRPPASGKKIKKLPIPDTLLGPTLPG